MTEVIARRLLDGEFTEQFTDQLRLLMQLDREAAAAPQLAMRSERPHARRYGR